MPTAARRPLWTALRGGVLLVVAVAMIETWLLDGLVAPYRVQGASMAGALLGVHRDVVCGECGLSFACDSDSASPPARAVCPNCGRAGDDVQSLPDVAGDRVFIDRAAFAVRAPRRWEVVALRAVTPPNRLLVKRVVGLPGESLEIRRGDVYVNGQIARKTLAEQRALAILVHDPRFAPAQPPLPPGEPRSPDTKGTGPCFRPTVSWQETCSRRKVDQSPDVAALLPQPPPRWRPERTDSRWNADGGIFHHAADPNHQSADWLVYRHWQRAGSAWHSLSPGEGRGSPANHALRSSGRATQLPSQFQESPVTDLCGYNQSQPRREEDVHPVTDLILSMRVHCLSGRGGLRIRIGDGTVGFEARLRFAGGGVADCAAIGLQPAPGESITSLTADESAQTQCDVCLPQGERLVEVSLVDQQILLAIDGQTVAAVSYERPEPPAAPLSSPAAIAADGIDVTVRDLRLYRDVYYTTPPLLAGDGRRSSRTILGRSEYYVLGDNSPLSDDSRTWPPPGTVDARLLLGKPLVSVPSALFSPWHSGQFQVPNLLRIRYIR